MKPPLPATGSRFIHATWVRRDGKPCVCQVIRHADWMTAGGKPKWSVDFSEVDPEPDTIQRSSTEKAQDLRKRVKQWLSGTREVTHCEICEAQLSRPLTVALVAFEGSPPIGVCFGCGMKGIA